MRIMTFLAASLLALTPSFAHEDFRLVGVVTKASGTSLSIRAKGAKTDNAVKLDRQTAIMRDGKKVTMSELKPGQTAVIDATGDTMDDLLALEVQIVPAIK